MEKEEIYETFVFISTLTWLMAREDFSIQICCFKGIHTETEDEGMWREAN
jgi:hypothetical protein